MIHIPPRDEPYIFEVWIKRPEMEVWGTQRQDFQTAQIKRFAHCFRFNSSVGRWIIVTDDYPITEQHAVNFARMIFEQKYKLFSVDPRGI